MTQYFICSIGEPGKDYDTDNLGRCVLHSCFFLHTGSKQKGPIDTIEPDDILILKFQHSFIAYGRALSGAEYGEGEGWTIKVPVAGWISGQAASTYGIQDAQIEGNNYQTIKEVNRDFARAKIAEIGFPI
jgi:hypothetical protein